MKQETEINEFRDKWYEFYYSVIYIPPGEVPQTKGAWTTIAPVEEMVKGLKEHNPEGTKLIVVSSRCGEISAEDADEWLSMNEVYKECAEAEDQYIKAGICSQCGACSLKEAETKCSPVSCGDSGDYSCEGERLWEEQKCAGCGGIATCIGAYEGAEEAPACDECCGHGNEDGHCRPISNLPTAE